MHAWWILGVALALLAPEPEQDDASAPAEEPSPVESEPGPASASELELEPAPASAPTPESQPAPAPAPQPASTEEFMGPGPWQVLGLPSFRFDHGARFPVTSTTATPIQYTLRVELGYDAVFSRWVHPTLSGGLGIGLRPHAAFRYDHMPTRSTPPRRLLGEMGLSLGVVIQDYFVLNYRVDAVLGRSGAGAVKAPAYGLRHGLEFGLGFVHRCSLREGARPQGMASLGVVGIALTHDLLFEPAPEQALALTAWVDGIQMVVGFINGLSYAFGGGGDC